MLDELRLNNTAFLITDLEAARRLKATVRTRGSGVRAS